MEVDSWQVVKSFEFWLFRCHFEDNHVSLKQASDHNLENTIDQLGNCLFKLGLLSGDTMERFSIVVDQSQSNHFNQSQQTKTI